MDVLKKIPHRHFVFSIPKVLRRYFLYDRKLLADLSRAAWESLKVFIQDAVPENYPIPGAVIAMQTFGDFLGFNPHCHILVTDGCFYGNKGMFRVAPPLELKKLDAIFQHKVFKMLLSRGKITKEMIAMLATWRHSGFHVFCGNRISTIDDTAMENLARYIIRASGGDMFRKPAGIGTCPRNESTWIRRQRWSIRRRTARIKRYSPHWNGLPRCVPTSRTGESRWCVITDSTATPHGENGRRKASMMPSPASSNFRETKRLKGKVGPG